MNPEEPITPTPELEQRLTALLLGELPEAEAAALRASVERDPEARRILSRLEKMVDLLREAQQQPAETATTPQSPLRLSESRRQVLLRQFRTIKPAAFKKPARRPIRIMEPLAIAAILVAILIPLMTPSLGSSWKLPSSVTPLPSATRGKESDIAGLAASEPMEVPANAPAQEMFRRRYGLAAPSASPAPPGAVAKIDADQISRGRDAGTERFGTWSLDGKAPAKLFDDTLKNPVTVTATSPGGAAGFAAGQKAGELGRADAVPLKTEVVAGVKLQEEMGAVVGRRLEPLAADSEALIPQIKVPPPTVAYSVPPTGGAMSVERYSASAAAGSDRSASVEGSSLGKPAELRDKAKDNRQLGFAFLGVPKGQATITNYLNAGSFGGGAGGAVVDAKPASGAGYYYEVKPVEKVELVQIDALSQIVEAKSKQAEAKPESPQVVAGYSVAVASNVVLGDLPTLGNLFKKLDQVGSGIAGAEGRPAKGQSTDQAVATPKRSPMPVEPETVVSEQAFSTFSLNVSDVSFKLAGASLEGGALPDPAGIRSEEFINAFDYRDPEPAAGLPIAFAWERARYPFAQNRDLLRFSLKTAAQGRAAGTPLSVVLLLDNSGSMERADRVRIIREALRVLASQLQPQDKLSVVTFARTAHLWVDGIAGDKAAAALEKVAALTPEGGTNLEEALRVGYETARHHYLVGGINRVVLLTDGAANLGDVNPEELKKQVESQRRQGVALDCFGIGWEGYNDDLLETLSRNGDGRYGFINTPEAAATDFAGQLAGALRVAASDVKVQVEFNPARVRVYRQIGYVKHQLTKEQFRDNTVDAAEIGAAESGNALYVIETLPRGSGPVATVRVRYKVPGTSDYREQEWAVGYQANVPSLEFASAAMRLAATAGAFSEWLAVSPYAAEVNPDRLLQLVRDVPALYGTDPRPQRLEWMIRQAKSLFSK